MTPDVKNTGISNILGFVLQSFLCSAVQRAYSKEK